MLIQLLLIAAGLALLYFGGEALVAGAVALSRRLGLSPLVIGMTVVAFGTSAPELAACLAAVLRGAPEIAFGNAVGSNIANLGLILGIAALLRPLATTARFLMREMPVVVAASLAMVPLLGDGVLGRMEGLLLVAGLAVFLTVVLRGDERPAVEDEFDRELGGTEPAAPLWRSLATVAFGLALLVAGADLLVRGAVELARASGVSDRVIGLTLVAIGTSLPELAASAVAALKREGDIALGNLVGSNIFNLLGILGVTALVRPIAVSPGGSGIHLAVMIGLALLVWPLMATRKRIDRWEGGLLLAGYGLYIAYLFG